MYKDVLRSIADIEIFPIIGFLIFMGVFVIITIHAFRMSRKEVSTLENLPFDLEAGEGDGKIPQ